MQKYNVLVVDDDSDIRESIKIYLNNNGINVIEANNGFESLNIIEKEEISLIIMDIMMPEMDGIKATLKIRETKNIPIIILSAKSEDTDKILGLNLGADDYVTKPFNPLELVARVKSQIRRYMDFGNLDGVNEINIRGIVLNKDTKVVMANGKEVNLTPIEYKILEMLMEHSGNVYSIQEIYTKVWNEPFYNGENTVAVHIRRIREKIEINPKEPEYLKVVWGIGYKFEK